MGADNADRVVVEAHLDAVGDADEIGGIDIHLTIDIGMYQTAVNVNGTITVALQADDLIRDETIDDGEWCMGHLEGGIDQSLALVAIGSAEQSELIIVAQEAGLNGVGIILFHHIDHFGADVADGRSLIGEFLHRHVGGHGEAPVMILQDVIVAIQQTRQTGQVRNHGRDLLQVDAIHGDCEVLLHRGVLILRIDLNTCLVVGYQIDIGLDMLVAGEEYIVVLVEVKLLITDGGALGQQFETEPVGFHIHRGTNTHTQFVFSVVESQACQGAMVVHMSIDETVEYELRILAVVAHLSLIGEPVSLLREVQTDGVDTRAVIVEGVDMALAVDASLRRGHEVKAQLSEIEAEGSEEMGDRVLALTFQVELYHGK